MNDIKHNDDASLVDFLAGWRGIDTEWVTVTYAVIGLTNFGQRHLQSTRLAGVLDRSVSEAEALARRWGWPGTRVEDGLITVDPERAKAAARRHVQVGDRRFGVSGCGLDILMYAPLVRPSLHLEETCTATGTPIRIEFTPSRVEHVEPAGAVVPMSHPRELDETQAADDIEEIDTYGCAQAPLYSSPEAAAGWLADHPGGRVFPIRQAWDLRLLSDWRDRMSTLLSLDN